MAMGEMTPRSPLQSDSEGSTSSLELGSGVAGLVLGTTPPTDTAPEVPEAPEALDSQQAVRCRWQHCGLWLKHLDQLAMHVTMVHAAAGQGGLFYCGWEGCTRGHRGFNARYKMLVHVRTHTNEKPHRCAQCDKSFSRAENLKIHARSHTGERPYACPVPGCRKAYSNSSDRFKHTRTHAVDKPYVCKVDGCPKRYTDPSSLRKHVKTYRHFPGPHGSPHGSSDDEARGAASPPQSVSPAALERLPLPGEYAAYRGIPIKKAISARLRGGAALELESSSVSDYEHGTDGSLSPLGRPGGVWASASASPDTLSPSPSSSPSTADWFPPMYPSVPSPLHAAVPEADLYRSLPWVSLWSIPSPAAVHSQQVAHGRAGLAAPDHKPAHQSHHPHLPHHAHQAAPLDLRVARH